jgi:hypothetical protein
VSSSPLLIQDQQDGLDSAPASSSPPPQAVADPQLSVDRSIVDVDDASFDDPDVVDQEAQLDVNQGHSDDVLDPAAQAPAGPLVASAPHASSSAQSGQASPSIVSSRRSGRHNASTRSRDAHDEALRLEDERLDRLPLSSLIPSRSSSQPPMGQTSLLTSFLPAAQSRTARQSLTQHRDHDRSHALAACVVAAAYVSEVTADPTSLREAMQRADWKQWEQAAQQEYDSIQTAGTWTLVPRPASRVAIGCKWVFRLKRNGLYKARLVAKGYAQKEGIDYTETFAPVAKFSTIRALLSLAAHYDLELHQMDVATAFLNGDLDVDIYMEQPEGFIVPGKEYMVCKLRKSLYGLKQAGRAWYQKIHQALLNLGFASLQTDTCVYILREANVMLAVALYVDDLLLLCNSLARLNTFKRDLSSRFRMKDLGEAHHILGIQIDRDRVAGTLSISQREYITKLLQRTGMMGCRPAPTPLDTGAILSKDDCPTTDTTDAAFIRRYQSAVGAIMYAMLGTRPDIAFAIMSLSQFCSNPGQPHWTGVNHLLHYLAGTVDYQLTYASDRQQSLSLYGFCDSDWASNQDDRRSVTGYVFMLGGGAVSWQAKKQTTVALSSVEAEYMAASQATKEALWWRMLLRELGMTATSATSLLSDSQGSIALSKNPEHHARSKHIAIRHHFVREQVAAGTIELRYISTDDMAADVLTKPLSHVKHRRLLPMLGLHSALSAVGVLE